MPRGNGSLPVIIQVFSEEEKLNRLRVILENAGDRNIAILLYYRDEVDKYHNLISGMGFNVTKWYNGHQPVDEIENILITTYKAAKGLEFQVVIMPDMHLAMIRQFQTPEHYYIGCTRAKESLFLTFTGNNLPDYLNDFAKDSYELIKSESGEQQNANKKVITDNSPF